jgi:hypothetical protein
MKKKQSYIQEMLADLDKCTKLLKESYVFDEGEVPTEYDDEPPYEGEEGPDYAEQEIGGSEVDDKIAQIRKLALDGIQEFAEDVDSEEYIFYKKVWMECDKLYTERNEQQNGGQNMKQNA